MALANQALSNENAALDHLSRTPNPTSTDVSEAAELDLLIREVHGPVRARP